MTQYDFSPDSSSMEQAVPVAPVAPAAEPAEQCEFSPYSSSMEQAPVVRKVSAPTPVVVSPVASAPSPAIADNEKRSKNGLWLVIAIIAICVSLLMGVFALWAAKNAPESFQIPQSVTPSYNYRDNVTEEDKLTPQEIIAKVSPSVVTVSVEGIGENGQKAAGFGTGIIYTDNGYILTNAHVIDGAASVSVTDSQGKTYTAKVVGSDADSDTAVIKIDATGLTPAEFGKSSEVVPGDYVIAIGTPYDVNLSLTATEGMVSALRESLNFPELGYTLDLIQHDAAINSGNSGGPLVNVYGQVIGINSIKISGTYENLGFALQIDDVLPLAEQLMNTGKVSRPGIGITGYTYDTPDMKGAFVYTVVAGGPADKAGLKPGDIIIKAGDKDIQSIDELKSLLQGMSIGDSVELTYLRNNSIHTTQLVLEELNAQ